MQVATTWRDERMDLITRAQAGHSPALEQLIDLFRPMARRRAKDYFIQGAEPEDVVQEAMIGLFKAIRDFDAAEEVPFAGFADICITRQLLTAVKTANRNKHHVLTRAFSLDASPSEGEPDGAFADTLEDPRPHDPETLALSAESIEELRDFMGAGLTRLEQEVVGLLVKGMSYEEMASRLDSHLKAIDNAIQRVRTKVRAFMEGPMASS